LRRGSATEGLSVLIELTDDPLTALLIPHGVAHGFYFPEPSLHLYGVTKYWEVDDEVACHWADRGARDSLAGRADHRVRA